MDRREVSDTNASSDEQGEPHAISLSFEHDDDRARAYSRYSYGMCVQSEVSTGRGGPRENLLRRNLYIRIINGFRWLSKASHDPNAIQKRDIFKMNGRDVFNKTGTGWIGETFS
jgi:hypothetical protein